MSDNDKSPDYEQTILAEIGEITLSWNYLEQGMESLIWHYIGGYEKGHIITAGMGNVTRLNTLNALCDCVEAIAEIKEHVNCFTTAFDILRLNRNAIVHSVGFGLNHKGDKFLFERLKKSVRTREYDTIALPLETLEKLCTQIIELIQYGETLLEIMNQRSGLVEQNIFNWPKPPPWPDKFPLPERLN